MDPFIIAYPIDLVDSTGHLIQDCIGMVNFCLFSPAPFINSESITYIDAHEFTSTFCELQLYQAVAELTWFVGVLSIILK